MARELNDPTLNDRLLSNSMMSENSCGDASCKCGYVPRQIGSKRDEFVLKEYESALKRNINRAQRRELMCSILALLLSIPALIGLFSKRCFCFFVDPFFCFVTRWMMLACHRFPVIVHYRYRRRPIGGPHRIPCCHRGHDGWPYCLPAVWVEETNWGLVQEVRSRNDVVCCVCIRSL